MARLAPYGGIENLEQAVVSPCVAPHAKIGDLQIEPRLNYYANPDQLQFTKDYSAWASLLVALDGATPRQN